MAKKLTPLDKLLKYFDQAAMSDGYSVHYEPNSDDYVVIITVDGGFHLLNGFEVTTNQEDSEAYITLDCDGSIDLKLSEFSEEYFSVYKRTKL